MATNLLPLPASRFTIDLLGEENDFRDFLHGLASLAALALEQEIRIVFTDSVFSQENSLGALDKLSRFEPFGQGRFFALQSRHFSFELRQFDRTLSHRDL
jgi:hypothetical protein